MVATLGERGPCSRREVSTAPSTPARLWGGRHADCQAPRLTRPRSTAPVYGPGSTAAWPRLAVVWAPETRQWRRRRGRESWGPREAMVDSRRRRSRMTRSARHRGTRRGSHLREGRGCRRQEAT